MSQEVLTLLDTQTEPPVERGVAIEVLEIEGVTYARLHSFEEADRKLDQAEKLCFRASDAVCGTVIRARGILAIEHGQLAQAREFFESSLSFAQSKGDRFLEASALLNLSASSLKEEHFDEAVDWADAANRSADAIDAQGIATKALGNLGWAYYNLGDFERSLQLSRQAGNRARELADVIDQLSNLNNAGSAYATLDDFSRAKKSYSEALDLANSIGSKQHIYNSLRALALVSVETDDLDEARKYAELAVAIARADNNRLDELYPLLVKGLIAARSRQAPEAERIFHEVDQDPNANPSLKLRSEHALARLYEDEDHSDAADREYRAALATFEKARSSLQRNDSKLPFSSNASRIYDDYVHFLVARGKTDDALRWADYSRARTLTEGLGLPTTVNSGGPPPLNPQQIARQARGTVLFYWLGEKQSYLWAITPQKISFFTLPPGAEIDAAVARYGRALGGVLDVLEANDRDGQALYRMLVAPAQALLRARPSGAKAHRDCRSCGTAKAVPFHGSASATSAPMESGASAPGAKVYVVPDGSLNNLNFETLLVSEAMASKPKLHYWIEDVTIANASSLRVLAAARSSSGANIRERKHGRSLLLVGNSVAPNDKFPELPKAAAQMESVARHFPLNEQRIFSRSDATPAAYLASNPEKFSYIHFVAHGTASRLSPLDSAIILSGADHSIPSPSPTGLPQIPLPENSAEDSFKLYARDIIRHPLHADLVTISACHGADGRAYSGEGLVGLSWAFILAGAHNVVAALWEVTDASTPQLMDTFYDELDKGASPDAALRAAKLRLLRSTGFSNPYYWAPFQLYAGS